MKVMPVLLWYNLLLLASQNKGERTIYRPNYGFSLHHMGFKALITGRLRFLFNIRIPIIRMQELQDLPVCRRDDQFTFGYTNETHHYRTVCEQFVQAVQLLHDFQNAAAARIHQRTDDIRAILDHIPQNELEDERRRRRRKRGIMSWIGSGVADALSLSTRSEVQQVKKMMKQVLSHVHRSNQFMKAGLGQFTHVTHMTEQRFDNIQSLLETHRNTIRQLYAKIHEGQTSIQKITDYLHDLVLTINKVTIALWDVQGIYMGVEQISHGHVSHLLLPPEQFYNSIEQARTHLQTVARKTILLGVSRANLYRYIILHAFTWGKTDDSFYLTATFQLPLTRRYFRSPMSLFRAMTFPLKGPRNREYYTTLSLPFQYILKGNHRYLTMKTAADVPRDYHINLQKTHLNIHIWPPEDNITDCAPALFYKDIDDIHRLCDYHVHMEPIPSGSYRLRSDKVLLNNIKSVTKRKLTGDLESETVPVEHDQVIYTMECETSLQAGQVIYYNNEQCRDENRTDVFSNDTIRHVINLALLRQYYNLTLLSSDNFALELNDSLEADLPALDIDLPRVRQLITENKQISIRLKDVVKAGQKGLKAYSSLDHYIINSLLEENAKEPGSFNIWSWIHWAVILLLIGFAATAFFLVVLRFRFQGLVGLVASAPRMTSAAPILLQPPTTTAAVNVPNLPSINWTEFHELLQKAVSEELILLLTLALIFLYITGRAIYKYRRIRTVKTSLVLEVSTHKKTFQKEVMTLRHPANYYRITILEQKRDLTFTKHCLYSTLQWSKGIAIRSAARDCDLDVPATILLGPLETYHLKHIIASKHGYSVTLILEDPRHQVFDILTYRRHALRDPQRPLVHFASEPALATMASAPERTESTLSLPSYQATKQAYPTLPPQM